MACLVQFSTVGACGLDFPDCPLAFLTATTWNWRLEFQTTIQNRTSWSFANRSIADAGTICAVINGFLFAISVKKYH